jgi:hypothetical protein
MFDIPVKEQSEKDIERKVCTYAHYKGFLCEKFTSPSRRFVPDRLFTNPNGVMFFIEFKRKSGVLTPGQFNELKLRLNQGVLSIPIYSVADGKKIIDDLTPVECMCQLKGVIAELRKKFCE